MSRTHSLDPTHQEEVFSEAIREGRQLVLTYNLPAGWQRQKAVFVSGSAATRETLVHALLADPQGNVALPTLGMIVGGSFRLGHKKCLFSSAVRSCGPKGKQVPILLSWPDHVSQLQRRAYERAVPSHGTVVAVRFWMEGEGQPVPESRDVRHGQLEDISAGGMRLKVADTAAVEIERTYKIVFSPRAGKPALVLDALLRHKEAAEKGRNSLGFQFIGLETTTEGLRTLDRLARLVSYFQRANTRRI